MAYINTREAARRIGVHPNTLRNWANANKIKHIKTPGSQRRYDVDDFLGEQREAATICYCRVSSYKQKDDLERQVEFMRGRFPNAKIVKDIGSALTFKASGILKIINMAMDKIACGQIKIIMAKTPNNKKGIWILKRALETMGIEVELCLIPGN